MATEFMLTAEGIDEASEEVAAFLARNGMASREAMAGRLSFENALILLREHLGDGVPASLVVNKLFGHPRLYVRVRGAKFNPIEAMDEFDLDVPGIANAVMEASGLRPAYAYRSGYNMISLTRPRPPLSMLAQILVAFVAGMILAFAGEAVLPTQSLTFALDTFITPLFNLYLGMLGGIAGPLVFLSVAWAVCDIGDVAALGKNGRALISRFLRDNVFTTIATTLICIPIFALPSGSSTNLKDFFSDLMVLIVGLFPTNIFVPFVEGNTTQIIILALFISVGVVVMSGSCNGIRKAVGELNSLAQFLMEQLCRFLPAFIFLMVLTQVWSGTFSQLTTAWFPTMLTAVLVVLFTAGRIAYTSYRSHVPFSKIFKAIRPPMVVGLTTASSSAAYAPMVSACTDELGVGKEQTALGVPLGIVMCQPSTCIQIVILMMYGMQTYGLGADASWYASLVISTILYSIAAPPVPGGMLICYGLLFAQLGIPADALVVAAAIDVILDYVVTTGRIGGTMLIIVDAARSIGAIDKLTSKGSV